MSPDKSPGKSPNKSPGKSPNKSPDKSPDKSLDKSASSFLRTHLGDHQDLLIIAAGGCGVPPQTVVGASRSESSLKTENLNLATQTWLGKLANLNAAKTPGLGVAPHKPLMIFSVMDLIESGDLNDSWVRYDADLVTRFRDYWDLVLDRRKNRPEITMPFNALGGERDAIWERFDESGKPSISKLTTRLCHLDPDLFVCLQDSGFRLSARRIMIATYFTPAEQVGLCERFRLPVPDTSEMEAFAKDRDAYKASQKKGRDNRFKAEVGPGYKYTCALTGYCLQTTAGYIVQAAHIHQHAKSGNDDPRNGLALTPDAHWMFDAGLWTVIPKGDALLIHVAIGRFSESSPHGRLLSGFDGQPLSFHVDARLRPDAKHFEWHRKTHLMGCGFGRFLDGRH